MNVNGLKVTYSQGRSESGRDRQQKVTPVTAPEGCHHAEHKFDNAAYAWLFTSEIKIHCLIYL